MDSTLQQKKLSYDRPRWVGWSGAALAAVIFLMAVVRWPPAALVLIDAPYVAQVVYWSCVVWLGGRR